LRGLIALNFLGLATILSANSDKAKQVRSKVTDMFKNMGGEVSKLDQSIENGSKRKPLFNKDTDKYTEDTTPPKPEDMNGFLGEAATAGLLVSAGAFILKIWNWVKGHGIKIQKVGEVAKKVIDKGKDIVEKGKEMIGKKDENQTQTEQLPATNDASDDSSSDDEGKSNINSMQLSTSADDDKKKKRRRNIIIGTLALVTIAGTAYAIHRRRNKKSTTAPRVAKLGKVNLK
jgi:hypothetical protein